MKDIRPNQPKSLFWLFRDIIFFSYYCFGILFLFLIIVLGVLFSLLLLFWNISLFPIILI